ncbi:hypothetical protein [Mesorhizobium sp.]|uniref:hypothetical protein n=1 Tax=Mesorhizobium sp. TaxID=1871066 RepID=UPI000FEA6BBC|nr:hypothetical protein [Mesorhizobium sp.]RWQ51104.1 MAG: hypothetical protein EOS83_22060 [Mesorhizobium sp.]
MLFERHKYPKNVRSIPIVVTSWTTKLGLGVVVPQRQAKCRWGVVAITDTLKKRVPPADPSWRY